MKLFVITSPLLFFVSRMFWGNGPEKLLPWNISNHSLNVLRIHKIILLNKWLNQKSIQILCLQVPDFLAVKLLLFRFLHFVFLSIGLNQTLNFLHLVLKLPENYIDFLIVGIFILVPFKLHDIVLHGSALLPIILNSFDGFSFHGIVVLLDVLQQFA